MERGRGLEVTGCLVACYVTYVTYVTVTLHKTGTNPQRNTRHTHTHTHTHKIKTRLERTNVESCKSYLFFRGGFQSTYM